MPHAAHHGAIRKKGMKRTLFHCCVLNMFEPRRREEREGVSEAQIDRHFFVCYRQGDFTGNGQPRFFKVIGQALLVDEFQETRAKGLVDLNGAVNDVSRYFFDVWHLGTGREHEDLVSLLIPEPYEIDFLVYLVYLVYLAPVKYVTLSLREFHGVNLSRLQQQGARSTKYGAQGMEHPPSPTPVANASVSVKAASDKMAGKRLRRTESVGARLRQVSHGRT